MRLTKVEREWYGAWAAVWLAMAALFAVVRMAA